MSADNRTQTQLNFKL